MKKICNIFIVLFLSSNVCYSQAKVDEKFELTSIMFALAGVPEYCQCQIPSYWEDIGKELTPYELTEPIHYIRELNQRHGIGYNAVSSTAEMLEIVDGKVRLQPRYDISEIAKFSSRWNEELFAKYIDMVNVFYKQSNFHQFFESHRGLYAVAERRMDELLESINYQWFRSFFGNTVENKIPVYVSICNGPNNYAMPEGVLIGMYGDSEGMPFPTSDNTLFVLVHEFGHHYTNALSSKYWPQMQEAADAMYPYVREPLYRAAYGDPYTAMVEWLNNLFTLMYYRETDNDYLEKETMYMTEKGFIWMQRSVEFMDNFYAHRDRYPYIEDFMPQLIGFLYYTADNYEQVIREYENRKPYITNLYPAMGSDISGFDEVIIDFSEPMLGSYGFYGTGTDDPAVEPLYFHEVVWSADKRQATLKLLPDMFRPGRVYGLQLNPIGFISAKYFPLDDGSKNLLYNTKSK